MEKHIESCVMQKDALPSLSLTESQLQNVFEKSWVRQSSYAPKWLAFVQPKRFQCLPTSLIVQELFGGELAVVKVFIHDTLQKKILKKDCTFHFSNVINGQGIDLTIRQLESSRDIEIGKQRELSPTDIDILYSVCENLAQKKEILQKNVMKRISKMLSLSYDELSNYLKNGNRFTLQLD